MGPGQSVVIYLIYLAVVEPVRRTIHSSGSRIAKNITSATLGAFVPCVAKCQLMHPSAARMSPTLSDRAAAVKGRLNQISNQLQASDPKQIGQVGTMSQSKNFEIAIVGGGISGLTLAIALYHRSIPVHVYEQAPAFGEIGAGVSFSPNALQAMKVCHQGIHEAFEKVCTRNLWPSKQKVWFDYLDGYEDAVNGAGKQDAAFTISNSLGQNGVHRAHFLDELVKLVPKDIASFGKRLNDLTENENGKMVMTFDDGTSAEADAVIGCDGIKSRVRQALVGADHPSAAPVYTHKYAYRGLVAMEDAVAAIGEERAQNACIYVGNDVPS